MGLLSRKLGIQAMSMEDPAQPLLPASALFESLGLGRSDAGVLINEKQAMRITTALACVKIVSEDLGTTSHEILQHLPDGSMRVATSHRLWPLLHDEPNPMMSANVFWAALLASMLAWGNGYAWIKRDRGARVISLVPLDSGRTSPVRIKGELQYATTQTDTGAVAYLDPADVLHVMYATLDGVNGLSPIQLCKNAFGLSLAAEKFGAQLFGNGARTSGVLTYPGQLEEEAYENLKKSVREMATGENGLRPIILEEGMDWKQISIAPNDAQFLETRRFQRSEIASLYRVAMHLLQDLSRATNNNIEHQSLDHVRYCLRPNAVRIEQEVNRKLLSGPFLMEHNLNDLQRGDFASQTAGLQVLRNMGVYSTNDCLRALRQNPVPAEQGGDIRIVQGAMIPLTALLSEEEVPETAGTDSDEGASQPFNRLLPAFRTMIRDAIGRILRRAPGPGAAEFAQKALRPALVALAQSMIALRFGHADLTGRELKLIEAQVSGMASDSAAWEKKDAPVIATRVTEKAYGELRKEILG